MPQPAATDLLDTLTTDWKRLKQQKARRNGGIEARVLTNLAILLGEPETVYSNNSLTITPQDKNKLYLKFNLIARRFDKLLGRLGSLNGVFKATPDRKDPKAYSEARIVTRLDQALDRKLGEKQRLWERLFWMAVGGTAFEIVPWIPDATIEPVPQFGPDGSVLFKDLLNPDRIVTQQDMALEVQTQGRAPESYEVYEEVATVGDVGSEVLGPLNVFIDQGVKSVKDLAPDQKIYVAKIRTLGWIEENFNVKVDPQKEFEIVSTTFRQPSDGNAWGPNFLLQDLIPLVQGSNSDNDPPMAVVVEAYTPQSKTNPQGRCEYFIPGQQVLDSYPSQYEGEIPIVDFHWQPVTTSFWTPDYVSDLIAPQRFINKRLSQLGEQSNATLYSNLLLGTGVKKEDIPVDEPGVVENAISDQGVPLVQRLAPPELPAWFLQSLDLVVKLFNDIAGGADLFQESKFPGQLRGPMAVPMLQEILDTEWGHLYEHLGERISLVKQMRLNRVKQFYPPIRTLHYTSREEKDEVLTFHTDKILRSGTNFNISIERGSLLPELRALREERIMARLNSPLGILYLDERTGRLDKSKIAEDLNFTDAGRESREAQYRSLSQEINQMLWQGQPTPPVLPFYDHHVMMDELESAMATTEFLRSSPQIQQAFSARWEQHRQFLMQEAQAQQMAMQSAAIHSAVAQATQQAAAQAAADTVHNVMAQLGAQSQLQQQGDTAQLVSAAAAQGGGGPAPSPRLPQPPRTLQ